MVATIQKQNALQQWFMPTVISIINAHPTSWNQQVKVNQKLKYYFATCAMKMKDIIYHLMERLAFKTINAIPWEVIKNIGMEKWDL
jgi:hypothetical protein